MMLFSEKLKSFEQTYPCQYKTVEGARYRYVLSGVPQGKTLVLLNGGMNTLEMWMDYVLLAPVKGTDREELDYDELYKPEYGETIDNDKLSKYTDALNNYIITIIGEKPQYIETYILILTTGIKVSIDKIIYDALSKILEKFEIKFE